MLEGLYDGIATPQRWQQGLLQVTAALGGGSAALVTLHRPTGLLSLDHAGTLLPDLEAGFPAMQDVDPARAAEPLLAAGHIYVDHDYHGAANLQRMPFYREFLIPHGIGNYALLPAGSGTEYLHTLSVQREAGRKSFTLQERMLMRTMQPHLRHALNLRQQLRQQRTESLLLKSTLDALTFPLIVCSAQGRVVTSNAAGQKWLLAPGCPLPAQPAQLSSRLHRLLEQACGLGTETARAGALMLPDAGVLVTLPFTPAAGVHWRDALALVAIQGPQWRPAVPGTLLRALFGLTPAEIRLVHHLLQYDDPLPAVAEQLQLSLNTLRTQLRAVFQKTHTRRQSDLLRLMRQLGLLGPGI
ncbi:hypothetical protein [Pantoea sp. 18069]|uniref:helix-turn-helix transcriptional regulator n=1 Tax=Pantoea sp. 18069 TaxID=2681415 RepID=UPI001357FBAA|nr:hypothetical protein [Pantoea sp. 18069]